MKNKAVIDAKDVLGKERKIISKKNLRINSKWCVIRGTVTIERWKGLKTRNDVEC
tara:strand:+ start:206 stop:370 length:165 start_codon:yes stop_codon:yes gene_type:complete